MYYDANSTDTFTVNHFFGIPNIVATNPNDEQSYDQFIRAQILDRTQLRGGGLRYWRIDPNFPRPLRTLRVNPRPEVREEILERLR